MPFDRQQLVFFKVLLSFREVGSEIHMHFLGQKTRRNIELGKLLDLSGPNADLFLKLANRTLFRILVLVPRSRPTKMVSTL